MIQPLLLSLLLAGSQPDTLIVPMPEVVVSGSRVRESLLRTPAAVSVVNRASYANGRGVGLDELLTGVPGVLVQNRSGAQDVRITIRGYGARGSGERSNTGNMRGIRILTDGIPLSEPDGRTNLDLLDIGSVDHIEVSRSNASALYGNASGGVVNLRTNLDFEQPFVRLEEKGGSFGLHREQATLGFRAGRGRGVVSASNVTLDGWRAHSQSLATQVHARFAVPLGETGGDRLLLLADYGNNLIRFPGPLTSSQLAADPKQANGAFVTRDDRRYHRAGRMAATIEHAFSQQQSLSVSAYAEPKVHQRSERGRFRDFTRYHVGGNAVWALDERLSDGLVGRSSAGTDEAYMDGSILFWNLTPSGGRSTTERANKREGANSAGGFVQQSLTWSERWSLQAALRYDNLWYVSQDFTNPALDATKHFTHITPKVAVSWLTGEHTVFAALGGGVESPAFNEIDPPPPFDTQTLLNPFLEAMRSTTYELGARGTLHGGTGTWHYDAGLYLIETTNEIVPFAGGAYFATAGKSRRTGLEAGFDWRPASRLTLRGSGTLMQSEYREYVNDLGDFGGNDMPGLPRTSATASLRMELVPDLGLTLSGEHVGKVFTDDANSGKTLSYGLVHVSIDYTVRTAHVGIRAFVSGRNLLDKEHVASVFINGTAGQFFEPGLPRSFAAGISLER